MNSVPNLTLQYDYLMTKRDVFCLKPVLRLEWQDQNGNEAEQYQHCALTLGDSLSQTMRIRFSVHTGLRRRPADHNRGHGRRSAEEGDCSGDARRRHGRDGLLNRQPSKNEARETPGPFGPATPSAIGCAWAWSCRSG